MNRLLIAENEVRIAAFLERELCVNGFATTVARSGQEAIALVRREDFDLLILDLGLPRKEGWRVLREVRRQGERLRVIILAALHQAEDTATALERGANDYVTKPFEFSELLMRIRVQLRDSADPRSEGGSKGEGGRATILQVGEIVLDLLTREVWVKDKLIEMSRKEFALTEAFLRYPLQVISREQLLDRVWGYNYDPGSNIVDVYIKQLRKKLGSDLIETVRGVGYRLLV